MQKSSQEQIDANSGEFPTSTTPADEAAPTSPLITHDQVLAHLTELNGAGIELRELRKELLGTGEQDSADPQQNPVNQVVKELRDAGKIHVVQPRFGEPRVSKLTWPSSPAEWASWGCPESLSGPEIVHLMRANKVTIEDLVDRMQITKKRIQDVRDRCGLDNRHSVRDWAEAILKPPVEGGVFTLDDHKTFRGRAKTGDITANEWKDQFERMLGSRTEFIAGLQKQYNATQLKNLAGNLGNFSAARNTKPENARAVFRSLLCMFLLEGSYRHDPMRETPEEAIARSVRAIDQAKLEQYFTQKGLDREAYEKAITNPETAGDFRTFIKAKGEDALSDEQVAAFDTLLATESRERRASTVSDTVAAFEHDELADGFEFKIIEGFHTKRQCKLWIAQLETRVDSPAFNELKAKAKQLGGWYSSFVKSQAGFQFVDVDTARRFSGLTDGDADRSDVLERRKERKEENAAERLTRLAHDLHERADATIEQSQTSLQNTARRADMQAGIRGRAYADQALARTVASVAQALETHEAGFLDGIRQKTHVELLQFIGRRARAERLRVLDKVRDDTGKSLPYDAREAERDAGTELADVRYAKYPYPTIYKRHLLEACAQCSGARGAKQATAKMRRRLQSENDDYVRFEHESDIEQLQDFLGRVKGAGHDTEWMDRELEGYKRARAANIHTLPELRLALRELLPHIGDTAHDSPVVIAERELVGRKLDGFFPTPAPIVEQMLQHAHIESHHRVLEPSAGKGDIAQAIRREQPECHLTLVEMNRTLGDVLAAKDFDPVFGDFLQWGNGEHFDRILMNPPFERSQDVTHVQHAYDLLAPGGKVIAIMSEGPFFRADSQSVSFREWLEDHDGYTEDLPDGAFSGADAFRQTGVNTRLVVIEK